MSVNIKTAMEQAMAKMLKTQTTEEPIMEQAKNEASNLTAADKNQEIVSERPMINAFTPSIFDLSGQVQDVDTPILSLDIPVNEAEVPTETTAENTEPCIGEYDTDFTFSRVEIDWSLFGRANTDKESVTCTKEETTENTEPCIGEYDTDFTFSRVEIEVKEPASA